MFRGLTQPILMRHLIFRMLLKRRLKTRSSSFRPKNQLEKLKVHLKFQGAVLLSQHNKELTIIINSCPKKGYSLMN